MFNDSSEWDHQLSQQLGGQSTPTPPKTTRARAIRELQEQRKRQREALAGQPLVADLHGLALDNDVPRTRAECPDVTARPCGHVRCRYNLLRDDQPAGRPGLASVPRDGRGRTLPVIADYSEGAHCSPPKLDATAWCRTSPRPSCALALADEAARRGRGLSNTELGAAMGRHRTLEARLVTRAAASFVAAGGTLEGLRALQAEAEAREAGRTETPLLARLEIDGERADLGNLLESDDDM